MINSAAIRNLFTLPFLIWAILFIFCPLVAIAWYGLTDSSGTFTLANISLIAHWEYLKSLELSLLLALVSTVVCLLVAYPLCLILTEEKRSKSTLLFLLFVLPMWMNSMLTTMVFIPSLTTFFISGLLGGNKVLLIGNIVEQEFTMAYDWHLGSGLSLVLMLFIIVNMVMTAYFDRSEGQVKK